MKKCKREGGRPAQLLSMLQSGREWKNNREELKTLITALDRMRIVPRSTAQHALGANRVLLSAAGAGSQKTSASQLPHL